jgi:hypothetical protein
MFTPSFAIRSPQGIRDNWGYFFYPQINIPPIIPPFALAIHEIYRTTIDKEKPANLCRMRVYGLLKISSDLKVVPEAGLEPAQAFTRGILSPLRLPIPPLRRLVYCKSLQADLASREIKKPAADPD